MNLPDLLLRAAAVHPAEMAVDIVDGSSRTYAELLADVRLMAGGLRRLGVGRGDRVALLGRGSQELVVAFHACVWIGATAVPVDARSSVEEVSAIIDDCGPALVAAEADHDQLAADGAAASNVAVRCELLTDVPSREADALPAAIADEELALILYTSGTTGSPKGVCLTHRAVIWNGLTICVGQRLRHDDAFLAVTPLSHAGAATRVFTVLVDAQRLVLARSFDAERFPRTVADHGVTTTILVPTMMKDLLDAHPDERLDGLRSVVYGAAPSAVPVIAEALDRWTCGLFHAYGLSEATTNVSLLPPEDHRPELLGSVGKPLPGVRVEVRDDSGAAAAAGEVGEVCVRSDKVMSGYWDRPAETAAALRDGWLHTGDLGRFDADQRLWLVGRRKELIIVGGNNVLPVEVETVLLGHPSVAAAAVVGGPHARMGEVPIAFVILAAGSSVAPDELVEFAASRLAPYKVPRTIIPVDAFPLTSSGKVAKRSLAERLAGDRR